MRILTPSGARHFCQSFSSDQNTSNMEVKKFLSKFRTGKKFSEGSSDFSSLRDCLLRDAERFTYLSAANYASTLRLLQSSTAPWACVGYYYSCFFSARALLAMHGGWVDGDRYWLDVTNINPGSIEVSLKTSKHPSILGNHGSHKAFWAVFYHACRTLQPYATPQHGFALSPVQSSPTWLIDNRNRINYGSVNALKLTDEFLHRFNAADVPNCLPGDIKVFRNVSVSLLALTNQFRLSHGLATDASAGGAADLTTAIDAHVRAPRHPSIDTYANAQIADFIA